MSTPTVDRITYETAARNCAARARTYRGYLRQLADFLPEDDERRPALDHLRQRLAAVRQSADRHSRAARTAAGRGHYEAELGAMAALTAELNAVEDAIRALHAR